MNIRSFIEFRFSNLAPICTLCVMLAVISIGCGGQTTESDNTETVEPASASFSIRWRTDAVDRAAENAMQAREAISGNCAGLGIATVEVLVYDGASMSLLTAQRWDCSSGQGYMDDIPPGANRQFVALGLNGGEQIVYRGQAANGVDFSPGQFVEVGYIEASPFTTGLPGTGQISSFTNTAGEDTDYPPPRPHLFTKLDDSGNVLADDADNWAMVRDELTGLIWELKKASGSGGLHDVSNKYQWQEANDEFIAQLNADRFGGYTGWRLPTIKELFVIANKGAMDPAIDPAHCPMMVASDNNGYWSSTSYSYDSSQGWKSRFVEGDVYFVFKTEPKHAIAVRGPKNNISLVDNGDGTVTDNATGLMWQKAEPGTKTWEEALAYCENLELAGHKDWRLPNINELQSIVDYGASEPPAIDQTYFPDTVSGDYWSSTTFLKETSYAWDIDFTSGDVYTNPADKSGQGNVRAVRYAN